MAFPHATSARYSGVGLDKKYSGADAGSLRLAVLAPAYSRAGPGLGLKACQRDLLRLELDPRGDARGRRARHHRHRPPSATWCLRPFACPRASRAPTHDSDACSTSI